MVTKNIVVSGMLAQASSKATYLADLFPLYISSNFSNIFCFFKEKIIFSYEMVFCFHESVNMYFEVFLYDYCCCNDAVLKIVGGLSACTFVHIKKSGLPVVHYFLLV